VVCGKSARAGGGFADDSSSSLADRFSVDLWEDTMATLEAVKEQIADTDARNRLLGRRKVRPLAVEQLERLVKLQELGALTDLEFQVQKRRILEALGQKV
jgi:hypothetical protein